MAGNKRKIWAEIALEGEKKFRSSVTSCNKSLSTMKSELNLVKQQSAGNANTLENLQKKHKALTSVLDAHVKKETAVKDGLDNAKKNYQAVGTELNNYNNKLQEAEAALKKMEASGEASEKELEEQRAKVEELHQAVTDGEQAYQRAGDNVQDWQRRLNNAQADTEKASRAVDENAGYMKEAEQSADGCAISIDKYGKKVSNSELATRKLNETVGKSAKFQVLSEYADKASQAFQKLADSSYNAAKELDAGYDTIVKKTGATGDSLDELNKIAENIFSELPVEMNMVGSAVGEVNTRFGLTGDKLQTLSEKFIKFAKINDTDVSSSVDSVQKAMSAFGLETDDCSRILDVMTKAGQDSGIGMNELGSALVKSAGSMKELGLSAEDSIVFIGRLEKSGIDTDTAISGLSKALKNATAEGKPLDEALSELEDTIINGTGSMDGLQASYELFGKSGDKIYNAVKEGTVSFKDLNGSVQEYGNVVENTYEATISPWDKMTVATNNLKSAGSELVGEFFEVAAPVVEGVTNVIKELKKWFDNLPEPAKKVVAGIGGIATIAGVVGPKVGKVVSAIKTFKVASQASKYLDSLTKAQKAVTGTTEALTGATEAENTVKELNGVLTSASATAAEVDAGAKVGEAAATEGAKLAQDGLNASMDACPVFLIIGAFATFGGILAAMAQNAENAANETYILTEAAEDAIEAMSESREQLNDTLETAQETVGTAFAKADIADDIVEKLSALAEKTELTAEEQRTMSVYVAELNELFPEMGLEIDEVTGKLNLSTEQIKEYVSGLEDMAKAEAYNEAFKDSFQGIVDAQRELLDAQAKQDKVQKRIADVQSQYNTALRKSDAAMKENGSSVIEWNGMMLESEDVLNDLQQQLHDLEVSDSDLTKEISKQEDAIEDATETAQTYREKYEELNAATADANAKIAENTAATNANTDAKNAQSGAAAASISVAGQELEAYQALSQEQQELAVHVTNSVLAMQESVTGALESQMNMFEKFNAGTEITKDQILTNMQSQVDGVVAWEQNMNALMSETKTASDGTQVAISEGLMQYLASMGPQGATYVQEFVNMSGDELAKANELWEQSVDIKGMTNDLGEQLTQGIGELSAGGTEAFSELAKALNQQANESGGYTVQGLVDGMKEAASQLEEAGEEAGDTLLESIDTSMGVQSPSWKTRQTGLYVAQGLSEGIQAGQRGALTSSQMLSTAVLNAFQSRLTSGIGIRIGQNISFGIASGIGAGMSSVITAASSVAQAAITAAQSKLQIKSPSRVFRQIGAYTVEGFVQGVSENEGDAADAIRSAMGFNLSNTNRMMSNAKPNWNENPFAESLADKIVKGIANSQEGSGTDAIYALLQKYLPDAGVTYMDGDIVSRKVTERQNYQAMIKSRIGGVR